MYVHSPLRGRQDEKAKETGVTSEANDTETVYSDKPVGGFSPFGLRVLFHNLRLSVSPSTPWWTGPESSSGNSPFRPDSVCGCGVVGGPRNRWRHECSTSCLSDSLVVGEVPGTSGRNSLRRRDSRTLPRGDFI